MILAIYRESDLQRGHPLADVVADLQRLDGVERRACAGSSPMRSPRSFPPWRDWRWTDRPQARERGRPGDRRKPVLRRRAPSPSDRVGGDRRAADGRRELRSPITDLGLPSSVRDVVSRRVCDSATTLSRLLTIAAVIGRTFDVELLDLLVEGTEDDLLDALEEALKASVLVESADRVGRFRFAHALINRALYDGLGATRRARVHRRVAEALEQLASTERGERLVAELLEDTAGSAGGSAVVLSYHWRKAGDSRERWTTCSRPPNGRSERPHRRKRSRS